MLSGWCPVKRAWSREIVHCRFLSIVSRLRLDLAKCEPSLTYSSPVINTKFGNNTHVRVRTITEHDTTESRQSRLQCSASYCDIIAFRQCPDHPENGDSSRILDAWNSRFGRAAHVWSITCVCVCHSLIVLWPVQHECCSYTETYSTGWYHGNGGRWRRPSVCQLSFEQKDTTTP